ncbi:MAG: imelysin family protein [Schleiferiaceae bacterium]|nr:imelysin family protein [Schleiferiaceae bacterium]
MKNFGIFASVLLLLACNKPESNPGSSYNRGPMLENMGHNVIIPSYTFALEEIQSLVDAIEDFNATPNTTELVAVKNKFFAAYHALQLITPYEFGPAENVALRGNSNTYPTDTLKIENAIASGQWNLDQLTFSDAKGLPAIDYLIFHTDADSVISDFSADPNRKQFLKECAEEVMNKISEVHTQWLATGGNYIDHFVNQKGTDVGSGTGMLVNALNQHFERFLRDGKIGIPVGIRSLGIAIPENCEAYYSEISLDLALENLEAIRRMYIGKKWDGTDGEGLDDHLIAIGAQDVDTQIREQLKVAEQALSGLQSPLSDYIISNQSQVEAAYAELQKLIVLFKVDMPSRLGVLITYQDNDGD